MDKVEVRGFGACRGLLKRLDSIESKDRSIVADDAVNRTRVVLEGGLDEAVGEEAPNFAGFNGGPDFLYFVPVIGDNQSFIRALWYANIASGVTFFVPRSMSKQPSTIFSGSHSRLTGTVTSPVHPVLVISGTVESVLLRVGAVKEKAEPLDDIQLPSFELQTTVDKLEGVGVDWRFDNIHVRRTEESD